MNQKFAEIIDLEKHLLTECTYNLAESSGASDWDGFVIFLEEINKKFEHIKSLCELDNKLA